MNLLKYLQAAGVPETLQAQALESLEQAREKARKVSPYKWSAPLVMAWVVPRLPWEAENLPERYAKWDNDISINGDPWGWAQREDGSWYRPAPLEDTPEARAACYWAKGHHPRSKWHRWLWLGTRNMASRLASDAGPEITPEMRPRLRWWGDKDTDRNHPGVVVHELDGHWSIYSVAKAPMGFVVRRNVGVKLGLAVNGLRRRAPLVLIKFSMPRAK